MRHYSPDRTGVIPCSSPYPAEISFEDLLDVFFTIDAGPQLKAVCTADAEPKVREALMATAGVKDVMVSGLGHGAATVTDA